MCIPMQAEQRLYETEGIMLSTELEFTDNAPTLAVLLGKPQGLLALLNEECRLPNGTDKKYAENAAKALQTAGHQQSHVTPAGLVQQLTHGLGKRQEATKVHRVALHSALHSAAAHLQVGYLYAMHCGAQCDAPFDAPRPRSSSSSRTECRTS